MRLRRRLAIALLLVLAACGPGTGGTGTGPVSGAISFGTGAAADGASLPASQCSGPCPEVQLRLEPGQVELQAGCVQFVHGGGWSVDASGAAVVDGAIESGGTSVAGQLRLQFDGAPQDSLRVTATLFDENGAVVIGPAVLGRQAQGAPAPTCRAGSS